MIDYGKILSRTVVETPKSGIRKFFDLMNTMDDVVGLTVGEPDFQTPWHIREVAIENLERGKTYYTANAGWPNPQACIGELTKYIVYNIDGVEYTAAFKLSALNYANLLMQDPTTVDLEKTAVIAMLTYVEEVYKYRAGENGISEANATKFNTFFDCFARCI